MALLRTQSPAIANTFQLARRYWPYVAPLRLWLAVSIALSLAAPPISGALLWLIKIFVDNIIDEDRFSILPMLVTGFVVAATAKVLVDYATARLEAWIAETIVYHLRAHLYQHVITLSPGSLTRHTTGDVLARLGSDVERTEILLYTGPSLIIADCVATVFFTMVLFAISWRLSLASFIVLPPVAWVASHYAPRVRRAARIARHRASGWLALAEEKITAGPIIHAYGTFEPEAARFAAVCAAVRKAELRTVAIEARLNLAIEVAVMLGGVLIAAAGAYELWQDALSLGDLVAFLGAISRLHEPVRSLSKATGRLQRGVAGARRVAELLDTSSVVSDATGAPALIAQQGSIEFCDVVFGYGQGNDALLGLSLSIMPGETVAIVGPSGSGKSTLIQLLLRLHDPDSGRILIDGTDIRDVSLASLRQAIAVVFQEPYLSRGSIADNVRYGAADPARLVEAGRIAYVEPFVRRAADGWATQVGPQGGWLSGGQRQRIAFARALMRDAPILVLDEATASVDSETEELIHAAITALPRRTMLLIGHRLSSLRSADRIVVIEGGHVVEQGTPAVLLRPGSRYHELFAAQFAPTGKQR
jgi:ABC-type multidrug transport system fused ATPase/permease subunit